MFSDQDKKLSEKKEKETKTKLSVIEDQKLLETKEQENLTPKERFINELYQGQKPLYAKDVDEKDEKSVRDFTAQARILLTRIKLEKKESIFEEINAELKKNNFSVLTDEEKNYIHSSAKDFKKPDEFSKEDLKDRLNFVQYKFSGHVKIWDDGLNRLFDPYHTSSLIPYNNNPKTAVDRIKAFDRGKYLLETLCYFISRPKCNPFLRETALTNTESAILVCPDGLITQMEDAIEPFESDLEPLVKHTYISQLASSFTNERYAKRGAYHGISHIALTPGNRIHADNELKDAIHFNNILDDKKAYEQYCDFAEPSQDSVAKGYFDKEDELKKFAPYCFDNKKTLQSNLIEILYCRLDSFLHAIVNKKSRDKFIKKLNSVGPLDEDGSTYTEEKESKTVLKEEKEITNALRVSLQKRLMTSDFLEGHISREKIPLEKKYSLAIIKTPFTEGDKKNFQNVIQSIQSTNAYVIAGRKFDFVTYRYQTLPKENELEKFFLDGHEYAYGIFEKITHTAEGKETIEKELYYLQKSPAEIQRINRAGVKKILNPISDFNDQPKSIKSNLGEREEKIRLLDTARQKQNIYYVKKDPFTIETVSTNQKIFQKINEENKDFEDTAAVIKSIKKHTGHVEPGFYINFLDPNYSCVRIDAKSSVELFFDYFQKLSDKEQCETLQHIVKDFKDFNDNSDPRYYFVIACMQFLKNPSLLNHLPRPILKGLLGRALIAENFLFLAVDKILQVNPCWQEDLLKDFPMGYVVEHFIEKDDSEGIALLFQKYHLSDYHSNFSIRYICMAAQEGKVKAMEILYHIITEEEKKPPPVGVPYMEGVMNLIKKNEYVNISTIITTYLKDENLTCVKDALRKKLLEYLNIYRYDKFKEALQCLPTSLIHDILDEKEPPLLIEAAKQGNYKIVNMILEKKVDKIEYQGKTYQGHYIEGLSFLIQLNKTKEAFELVSEYLKLTPEEQKSLEPNFISLKLLIAEKMIEYSQDLTTDGVKNLENLLKISTHLSCCDKKDIDTRDSHGNPLIFYAANVGNLKALELLRENGANFEEKQLKIANNKGCDFYDNLKLCIGKLEKNNNYDKIDEIIKNFPEVCKHSNFFKYLALYNQCFRNDAIINSLKKHCNEIFDVKQYEKNREILILLFDIATTNEGLPDSQHKIATFIESCNKDTLTAILEPSVTISDTNVVFFIYFQVLKKYIKLNTNTDDNKNKNSDVLQNLIQDIEKNTLEKKPINWINAFKQLYPYILMMKDDVLKEYLEVFGTSQEQFLYVLMISNYYEALDKVVATLPSIKNVFSGNFIKQLDDKLNETLSQRSIVNAFRIKNLLLNIDPNYGYERFNTNIYYLITNLCECMEKKEIGKFKEVIKILKLFRPNNTLSETLRMLNMTFQYSESDFIYFCLQNSPSLDYLLKEFSLNAQDNKGYTELHLAAQKNNHPLILKLVENGINIHIEDLKNNTAFHYGNDGTKALILMVALKEWIHKHFGDNLPPIVSQHLEWINNSLKDSKSCSSVIKKIQESATASKPSSSVLFRPAPSTGNLVLDEYLKMFDIGFFNLNLDLNQALYSNIKSFENPISLQPTKSLSLQVKQK